MQLRSLFGFAMLVAMLALSTLSLSAFAQQLGGPGPGAPAIFYGTVTINGAPAPDGTTVSATVNNINRDSTTSSGGEYDMAVQDSSNSNAGKTVQFSVNGVAAQTAIFLPGEPQKLDLSVTISSPQPPSSPPSSSPSSGGGGGGGGGGSAKVTAVKNESVTEEQKQLIAAAVENSLPPLPASPPREEPVIPAVAGAIAETQNKPSGGGFGAITGFLVGIPGKLTKNSASVVVLALVAAVAFYAYKKKRSKSPKGEVAVSK